MSCPDCGTLMNRHAEKLIKTITPDEREVVAAVYACPACGKIEAEEIRE